MPQNVNTDFGHCLIPEIAQNFSISGLTGKDGKKSKNFATVTICAARGDFFSSFFFIAPFGYTVHGIVQKSRPFPADDEHERSLGLRGERHTFCSARFSEYKAGQVEL